MFRSNISSGSDRFPGLKWPGRGVDHPNQSGVEVKERVRLYLYSASGLHALLQGEIYPFSLRKLIENTEREAQVLSKNMRIKIQRVKFRFCPKI